MRLCLVNHNFKYELEKLIRLFLPFEKIEVFEFEDVSDYCIVSKLKNDYAFASLYIDDKNYQSRIKVENYNNDRDKDCELALALAVFECFTDATGYFPDWGILTGIRPAKLLSRLKKEWGTDKAEAYFSDILKVNPKKMNLCRQTLNGEGEITSLSKPGIPSILRSFLYIS